MSRVVSFIACADIHIRVDVPECRIDCFQDAMWDKLIQILDLSVANRGCPVLISGDLGYRWNWANWLLERFFSIMDEYNHKIGWVGAIPGQHDLPQHSLKLINESGIGVLWAGGAIDLMLGGEKENNCIEKGLFVYGFPYKVEIEHLPKNTNFEHKHIALIHQFIAKEITEEWQEKKVTKAADLLKKFPEYNIIISGDNHQSFTVQHEGRWLINPGSMMRTTADQIDHRPSVYLYYAEDNTVERHYLEIQQDVITRGHLEAKEEKEQRMKAYVELVKNNTEIKLSFEDNMEEHLKQNPENERVENKIWQAIEN